MEEMRARRSFRIFATGAANSAVTLLVGIAATPFVLKWLGTDTYGLFRMTLDWLGYLVLLELGLSEALVPLLVGPVAQGKNDEARKALVAGVRAYLRVIVLKIVVGFLMIAAITTLVPADASRASELRLACLVGLISSLLCPLFPFRTLLEVQQQSYRTNQWLAFQGLLTTGISLLFAGSGFGLVGQFAALLIGGIPFHAMLAYHGLKSYPGLGKEIAAGATNPDSWRSLWKMNTPLMISNVCSRLALLSDNLIIGLLHGPSAVTAFYLTQRIITVLQGQLYGVGSSTWAGLSEMQALGHHDAYRKRSLELTTLTVTAGLVVLGPVVAFNSWFIGLWVGPEKFGGLALTTIASTNAILLALFAQWSWGFLAKGIQSVLVPQYLAFTAINVGVSIVATRALGMPGPALGTLVAALTTTLWVTPRKMSEHFGVSAASTYLAILKPLAILGPLIAIVTWFSAARGPVPGSWMELALYAGGFGAVLAALAWYLILTNEDRELWRRRFGRQLAPA